MELTKVKGPTIRWADIEAADSVELDTGRAQMSLRGDTARAHLMRKKERLAAELSRLGDFDNAVRTALGFTLPGDLHPGALHPDDIAARGLDEHLLVVGAIDFGGSSHPEQRGIWSARRTPEFTSGAEHLLHPEAPYITVMLRPGGPRGQAAEDRSLFPARMISYLGMRLLGVATAEEILDSEDD